MKENVAVFVVQELVFDVVKLVLLKKLPKEKVYHQEEEEQLLLERIFRSMFFHVVVVAVVVVEVQILALMNIKMNVVDDQITLALILKWCFSAVVVVEFVVEVWKVELESWNLVALDHFREQVIQILAWTFVKSLKRGIVELKNQQKNDLEVVEVVFSALVKLLLASDVKQKEVQQDVFHLVYVLILWVWVP